MSEFPPHLPELPCVTGEFVAQAPCSGEVQTPGGRSLPGGGRGQAVILVILRKGIGFEESEVDEKEICGAESDLVVLLVGVEVEEGVAGPFEFHELAAVLLPRVALGESGHKFDRDETVVPAMVDDTGRESGAWKVFRRAVMPRLLFGGKVLSANPLARRVDQRAEKNECGRPVVLAGFVSDLRHGGAAEREVSTRGGTGENDLVGVDAKGGGILAEKNHRHRGIFQRLNGRGSALAGDPVLDAHADRPTSGEVQGVRDKLGRHGEIPHATMEEEYYGRGRGPGIVARREEKVSDQVSAGGMEVNEGLSVFEKFTVARFADGRGLDELVDHGADEVERSGFYFSFRTEDVHSFRNDPIGFHPSGSNFAPCGFASHRTAG